MNFHWVCFLCFISFATAERVIRFSFNNGVALPGGEVCNAADTVLIDAIFARNTTVRHLSGTTSSSGNHEERQDAQHRQLPSFPTRCRQDCIGQEPTYCRATGCQGYRRHLPQEEDADRDLQSGIPCVDEILDMNKQLDALVTDNKVSAPCQRILNSTRFPICYDDIIFGVVESFTLWNGATDQIIAENVPNGYEFCKSIPFNIEVKTNPCVDFISYNMTGNMGFKFTGKMRLAPPYFVFNPGPSDPLPTGPGDVFGRANMRNGTFSLVVTPDGFWSKKKELVFHLKNC